MMYVLIYISVGNKPRDITARSKLQANELVVWRSKDRTRATGYRRRHRGLQDLRGGLRIKDGRMVKTWLIVIIQSNCLPN